MSEKWDILDISVIRRPLLPLSFFLEKLSDESEPEKIINLVLDNSLIKEAIYFANPRFLIELEQFSRKSNKKKRNIISTLYKYLSRISTRATPFGLFSGIQEVSFEQEVIEHTNPSIKRMEKKIRVDSMWLLEVIKKIEEQEELWDIIAVKFSKFSIEEGNRIVFPYRTMYGQFNEYKEQNGIYEFSVKNTDILKKIKGLSNEYIHITKLIMELEGMYPDVQREKFSSYINEIISLEILQSNLRPQLTSCDNLDDLLDFFENYNVTNNPFYIKLYEVREMIKHYSGIQIGENNGILLLDEIINKMNEISESKDYLHIDLKSPIAVSLPIEIKNSVSDYINIIKLFSAKIFGSQSLHSYRREFLDKYGYNTEINLIELLYSLEFGSPKSYEFPQGKVGDIYYKESTDNEVLKYMEGLISEAIFKGSAEIVITDEQINLFKNLHNIEEENLNESFDMMFTIVKNQDNYYLTINNDGFTDSAGQLIGRFAYLLNDRYKDEFKSINTFEKILYGSDYSIAEVSCQSIYGRASNISTTINMRDNEIPIICGNSNYKDIIEIDSIVCGINNYGYFYLRDKKTGKLIIPKTTDMLHGIEYFPNLYRFLLDIEKEGKYSIRTFFHKFQSEYPFSPRIMYKNIILSKRHWNIDRFILNLSEMFTLQDWIYSIDKWKNVYKVPDIIEVKHRDSTIFYNLENSLHLEILMKEFLKGGKLQFTEVDYGINQETIKDGIYKEEVTVTVLNNSSIKNKSMILKNNEIKNRKKIPGDDWIYYKLYIKTYSQDDFLMEVIDISMDELLKEGRIESYFYVRYEDTYPHIRLRIKTVQPHVSFVFNYMFKLTKRLSDSNILSNISIDTYYPEYMRYGGKELEDIIHTCFFIDSQISINLLNYKARTGVSIDELILYSVNRIFQDIGFERNDKIKILNRYIKHHGLKKKNLKLSSQDIVGIFINEYDSELKEILDFRSSILQKIKIEIENANNEVDYLEDIILSIVHMNVNRLMVINREKEHELMYLLLRVLEKT